MNKEHQEQRQSATQQFIESLDQLEQRLASSEDSSPHVVSGCQPQRLIQNRELSHDDSTPRCDSLQAFEDAAADIEQFLAQER